MDYAFWANANACAAFQGVSSLDEVLPSNEDDGADGATVGDLVADRTPDSETAHIQQDLLRSVAVFVDTLPPRLRDIAYRHYWLDESQVEIAAALRVTRSAICHALAKVARLGRAYFGGLEN